MKSKYMFIRPIFMVSLVIYIVIILISCNACGSKKNLKDLNKDFSKYTKTKDSIFLDDVKIDTSTLIRTSLPELITFKYYNQEKNQFEQYDEYNYARKILVFKDSKTKNVIKEIDIVKDNPFHAQGFKRKKESYTSNFSYFLYKKGTENKYDFREYLPNEIFDEIPNDFDFERGMASISHRYTADKYVTVTYEIFWNPDTYTQNMEYFGPGYGAHFVVVYDSVGTRVFFHKYGGTSHNASISADGKYVFNMICISPEWDKNLRFHFTVNNVSDGSIVYEVKFENCMRDGGNGGADSRSGEHSNGYGIGMNDGTFKEFRYSNGKFYTKYGKNANFDSYELLPKEKMKVNFKDGTSKIVSFDNYYETINLK